MKISNQVIFILLFFIFYSCGNNKQDLAKQKEDMLHDNLSPEDSVTWMNIIAEVDSAGTREEFQAEFKALQKAAEFCKQNKYYIYLFQVYFIHAQRLEAHGNSQAAEQYIDSAAAIVKQHKLEQLNIQMNIALASKTNIRGTDSAIYYYKKALEDTSYMTDITRRILYTNLSRTYISKAHFTEAKDYTLKALALIENENFDNRMLNKVHVLQYLFTCDMGLKDTAKAYEHLKLAYQLMMDSLQGRGDYTIYTSMGDYHYSHKNYDSALFYYSGMESRLSEVKNEASYNTLASIIKAKVYAEMGNIQMAQSLLNKAEKAKDFDKIIKDGVDREYYGTKYKINKENGNLTLAIAALEKLRLIENEKHQEEKSEAVANFEKELVSAKAEHKIASQQSEINNQKIKTLTLAISSVILALIGAIIYIILNKQKQKEKVKLIRFKQQSEIEKSVLRLNIEYDERKRISQEIHDDIGPALTSLNLASNILISNVNNKAFDTSKPLEVIQSNTSKLSSQLNEIIWSLNTNNDSLESLASYIKKFASSITETAAFDLEFENNIKNKTLFIAGYIRRNIYQTVKEIIHNAIKHSKGKKIQISINQFDQQLIFKVKDDGIGLPANELIEFGNGLKNIVRNIQKIGGKVLTENNNGLSTVIDVYIKE